MALKKNYEDLKTIHVNTENAGHILFQPHLSKNSKRKEKIRIDFIL